RASRGAKTPLRRKISFDARAAEEFAEAPKTFGNSRSGGHGKKAQIERAGSWSRHVTVNRAPSHRRHLAFRRPASRGHAVPQRPAARAGVVKHLPLFFDLGGRRVVIVGAGAMADRRAELARSAGAAVFQIESATASDLKGA